MTLPPIVGDVEVAGRSVPELTTVSGRRCSGILIDAVIVVLLKEFEKPHFMISGEVEHPGKYEMKGDLTFNQAVAIAGGFKEGAKHTQVRLFRRTSEDWVEVRTVHLKDVLKGALKEGFDVLAGDIVYVPKAKMADVKPFLSVAVLRLWFLPFWWTEKSYGQITVTK